MPARQEVIKMFGDLTPSRKAVRTVEAALRRGVDPSSEVQRAITQALETGRKKVCIKPGSPLNGLNSTYRR